jgi:hypothetical protein
MVVPENHVMGPPSCISLLQYCEHVCSFRFAEGRPAWLASTHMIIMRTLDVESCKHADVVSACNVQPFD